MLTSHYPALPPHPSAARAQLERDARRAVQATGVGPWFLAFRATLPASGRSIGAMPAASLRALIRAARVARR